MRKRARRRACKRAWQPPCMHVDACMNVNACMPACTDMRHIPCVLPATVAAAEQKGRHQQHTSPTGPCCRQRGGRDVRWQRTLRRLRNGEAGCVLGLPPCGATARRPPLPDAKVRRRAPGRQANRHRAGRPTSTGPTGQLAQGRQANWHRADRPTGTGPAGQPEQGRQANQHRADMPTGTEPICQSAQGRQANRHTADRPISTGPTGQSAFTAPPIWPLNRIS
eukprot:357169-Chlamydomonas_euryale.AAC.4